MAHTVLSPQTPNQTAQAPAPSILVADIGGTNARLAIADLSDTNEGPALNNFQVFSSAENKDLDTILTSYFSSLDGPAPRHACLAVAGPIVGETAHITNLGWHLDRAQIASKFNLQDLKLVNDFAALARAAPALGPSDLINIQANPAAQGPISVMGPGTGFGLALLVNFQEKLAVVPCEGGHVSFVPQGELERKVWAAIQHSMGRVTVETLLSGVGLMRIYRELCHLRGITPLNYDPSTISNQALDHKDEICLETLGVFCSMLGSVAGDIVLSHGSRGGVFLGGGILPKILDYFLNSKFLERFTDKPPLQEFVSSVPVHVITAPDAALKGAALMMRDTL